MKNLRLLAVSATFLLALIAGACGSSITETGADATSETSDDVMSIEGTWNMVSFNGVEADTEINTRNIPELDFADGMFTGNFGCNNGGGSYEQTGNTMLFSDVGAEEAGCLNPDGSDGLNPTETFLLQLFNSGEPVEVQVTSSSMTWTQDNVVLEFTN